MGIIFDILSAIVSTSEDDKKKDDKLEKEMDEYDLEEWQKELVRKGEYEPWNFDEDELEEEDYYFEDEK